MPAIAPGRLVVEMPDDEQSRSVITSRPTQWGGPRPKSLVYSLLVHSIVVFSLLWFSGGNATEDLAPREQAVEQHQTIVWYHLKEIPKISPSDQSDDAQIKAERLNPAVIIHQAPDAARDDRLVFRAPERKTPPQKTPAPDMIAVARGADATRPPEHPVEAAAAPSSTKAAPKSFVAPAAPPPAATARIKLDEPPPVTEPPKLAIPDADLSALTAGGKVRFSKRFVPPPPTKAVGPADTGGGDVVPDAPTLPGAGGASDINALVVNTVHAGAIDAAPPRQSSISVGPVTGPSSEHGGQSGMRIAGITVIPKAGTGDSAEASLKNPKDPFKGPGERASPAQPYITTRIAPLEHTFSAPLPPSSRNIPRAIEARFHGRIVYTMLLPMKGLPGYAGDWTIWFAEREEVPGGSPAPMRAPLPFRKPVRADAAGRDVSQGVVQLSASMNKMGKIDSVAVIGGAGTSPDEAIEDLKTWEFLPALRNREAVEIDFIIEIPFGISQKAPSPARVPVLSGVDRTQSTPHN
jgi:Gram-negative bacterial TonB protein C-terminal